MKFLSFIFLILLTACSKPAIDPAPLTLIPESFQFVAKVDVPETLNIPGINSRIAYEQKRKPTLQVLPLKNLQTLYIAAGSPKDTEEKGSLFIALFKQPFQLNKLISSYTDTFKDNKQVILSKSKLNQYLIHTVRDRKQELAICQLGPKTCIAAPLTLLLSILKKENPSIQNNKKLLNYLTSAKDYPLALFLLSGKELGSLLQNFQFFDSVEIKLNSVGEKNVLAINAQCTNEENALKTSSALTLLQTVLMFSKGKHIKPNDVSIKQDKNMAKAKASFSREAMIDLFAKQKK